MKNVNLVNGNQSTNVDNYILKGFKDRRDYLESMAATYQLPLNYVKILAQMLGKNEDFDGLLVALDDASIKFN